MRSALLQIVSILIACAVLSAQRPTIPEIAAGGESTDIAVHEESVGVALAQLSASADVVMQGTARLLGSRLSADEYHIYTDYALDNPSLIGQAQARQRRTPAPVHVVFRQLGGEIVINGVRISMTSSALPLLSDGAQVIVFLQELESEATGGPDYELVNSAGALGIEDSRVVPLSRTLNKPDSVRGRSVAEIRTMIAAHRESLAKPK